MDCLGGKGLHLLPEHRVSILRLLRALSPQVLKTSKDGNCAVSLNTPAVLQECPQEMLLFISSLNLQFQFMAIVSHSSAIWKVSSLERAWFLVGTGKFSSKPSLPWAEQAHFLLLTARVLQPFWCAHGVLLVTFH